ncbi:hypothetical protein QYM36_015527 [Artemia franciscana]|uniref:Uncharacterized protein n=1 Tax=Artemia franciscana TaxID=6661 RepID=A0AA88HIW6_ARTSF|nr:hypothetical protein QYM36_015527 [Artemia franciscana]
MLLAVNRVISRTDCKLKKNSLKDNVSHPDYSGKALKDWSLKLEAWLVAISALQSEIKGQLSAKFSGMKSEIQLLNSKLSEKDKLISELNLRIEHQSNDYWN